MSKKIDRTGEKSVNNFGSTIVITEYRNSRDVDIYFPQYNWTKKHVMYNHFKQGDIKCPYEPRVYGVGYLGEGEYVAAIKTKCTKTYNIWKGIIERCYDYEHKDTKYPTYENCTVCDEWLCFQNFAKWYENNYYEIPGQRMAIDKDILVKGNKVYSPDTCIIVPQFINSLFLKSNATRGEYPIGIRLDEEKNILQVRCNIYENGKSKIKHLGYFNTDQIAEAFYLYKTVKEANIKAIADEYKDKIPQELYDAMYNYEVEYDD